MAHLTFTPISFNGNGLQLKNIAKGTASTDAVRMDQVSGSSSVMPFVTVGTIAGQCDYLCDGTADNVEIQAAITAITSTGGIVFLKSGTYNLAAAIDVPSKVHILGTGRRNVLVKTNGAAIKAFTLIGTAGNYRFDQKLANFEIRGNNSAVDTSNILIDIQYSDEWLIEDVYVRQGYDNIRVAESNHGRIHKCEVRQGQHYNINIADTTSACNYLWVNKCWISRSYLHNIYINGGNDISINDNAIEDGAIVGSGYDGVHIDLTTYSTNRLHISNNHFRGSNGSQRYAVEFTNGAGTATLDLSNNTVVEQATASYGTNVKAYSTTYLTNEGSRFGNNTNYTNLDTTGHITFGGSAKPWEDLRIEPTARTTGANAPSFEKYYDDAAGTSRGVYLYSFDDAVAGSEKEVFFNMQMPHNWDGGSIQMHVHWVGSVDDTTSAPRWGLEYAWKEIGATFGDTTIVYSDGSNYTGAGTDANITTGIHYVSKFTALVPGSTADSISSILVGRLFRDSADAGDTYNAATNKCGLLYIDAHYQLARVGSDNEYTA
jgi:hypothetical protein